MTGQSDVPRAVRGMKAGAVDLIEKPFDDPVLFTAIEAAFTRASRSDRLSELEEASRRIAELSPREREVLDALVAGQSNKVIAFELGLRVGIFEVDPRRMMGGHE